MSRSFPVKEIALQAGVSTATVDRVLNTRGMVRRSTVLRVHQALAELESQAVQLARAGRKLNLDVVAEAPQAFLDALDAALRAELPLQPVPVRARRDIRSLFAVDEIEQALRRIARRGSDGVILMAPDALRVRRGVDSLAAARIPVVTLATDISAARAGYVGLDNRRAGTTAAWFIARLVPGVPAPRVLVTIRNDRFRGEEEREKGFREALARALPSARLSLLVEGSRDIDFADKVAAEAAAGLDALYSIGGNNRRILRALAAAQLPRPVVVAHDLDPDNRALLATGAVDVVLYHDLSEDVRNACRTILALRDGTPLPAEGATLRIAVPPMSD